jgi:hypothetical protein
VSHSKRVNGSDPAAWGAGPGRPRPVEGAHFPTSCPLALFFRAHCPNHDREFELNRGGRCRGAWWCKLGLALQGTTLRFTYTKKARCRVSGRQGWPGQGATLPRARGPTRSGAWNAAPELLVEQFLRNARRRSRLIGNPPGPPSSEGSQRNAAPPRMQLCAKINHPRTSPTHFTGLCSSLAGKCALRPRWQPLPLQALMGRIRVPSCGGGSTAQAAEFGPARG